MAAGDIACAPGSRSTPDRCRHAQTAALLTGADRVLALGDLQYDSGALNDFRASYDPTWGQHKAITAPVPGNHEYQTADALGYFSYFGAAAHPQSNGYYSYDVGTWHMIALNTASVSDVPTEEGSPQEVWLKADLAEHPNQCVLAYWHHPLYTAGGYYPGYERLAQPLWVDLYAAGADVVLNGHDHDYQRFALMDPAGVPDPRAGIREFVVGTGGKSHDAGIKQMTGLQYANGTTFGVLKLTLRPASYEWAFISEDGDVLDKGSDTCV